VFASGYKRGASRGRRSADCFFVDNSAHPIFACARCLQIAAGAPGAEPAEFTAIAGLSDVAQIAAGWGVTCARKNDGSV